MRRFFYRTGYTQTTEIEKLLILILHMMDLNIQHSFKQEIKDIKTPKPRWQGFCLNVYLFTFLMSSFTIWKELDRFWAAILRCCHIFIHLSSLNNVVIIFMQRPSQYIMIQDKNNNIPLDCKLWHGSRFPAMIWGYNVEVDCWYRALESRTSDIGRVLAGPGSEAQSHVKGNFNSQYSPGSAAASSGSVHWVLQHQQVTCKLQLPGDSGDTLTCGGKVMFCQSCQYDEGHWLCTPAEAGPSGREQRGEAELCLVSSPLHPSQDTGAGWWWGDMRCRVWPPSSPSCC